MNLPELDQYASIQGSMSGAENAQMQNLLSKKQFIIEEAKQRAESLLEASAMGGEPLIAKTGGIIYNKLKSLKNDTGDATDESTGIDDFLTSMKSKFGNTFDNLGENLKPML